MAKTRKKAAPEGWDPSLVESPFDAVFESVTTAQQKEYPTGVFSGGAEAMQIVCLPVPSFAIRFLLQQEGWPLGRFVMVVGEQESCKSAFVYEVIRWHTLVANGGGVLINVEAKDSPELLRSIIGYETPRLRIQKCRSLQEWNAALRMWVDGFKVAMDGYNGAGGKPRVAAQGRKAPVCFGIDSLMAALPDKLIEKIDKEGASTKHFADAAQLLNDYFKYINHEIDGYPFSLIGINHMKPRDVPIPGTGIVKTERNIAGGYALKFHETAEIQMTRLSNPAPGKEINRVADGEKGIELRLSVFKNSMAPHEKVDVDMLWHIDYEDRDPMGHFRQKTFFDWDAAAIELLADLSKGDGKVAKRLRAVIDLEVDRDTRKVWCSELGIKQKDKLRYREAGAVLEAKLRDDPGFRDALYAETGIRRRYLFQPGIDYLEQVEMAVQLATVADHAATGPPLLPAGLAPGQNLFDATAVPPT